MKTLFSSVLFAVLATSYVNAQTSSGNMMVGGTINFSSTSYEGGSVNNESNVTFSPSFGYFVSENLAIGASLTLTSSREGTGAGKTLRSSFGIGPFARYYMFSSNENFAFFGQAALSFASGKTDPPVGGVTKSSSIAFSLAPGAAYFINEHWALELALTGFVINSRDPNTGADNNKITTVEFGLSSFSPSLGFRYHF